MEALLRDPGLDGTLRGEVPETRAGPSQRHRTRSGHLARLRLRGVLIRIPMIWPSPLQSFLPWIAVVLAAKHGGAISAELVEKRSRRSRVGAFVPARSAAGAACFRGRAGRGRRGTVLAMRRGDRGLRGAADLAVARVARTIGRGRADVALCLFLYVYGVVTLANRELDRSEPREIFFVNVLEARVTGEAHYLRLSPWGPRSGARRLTWERVSTSEARKATGCASRSARARSACAGSTSGSAVRN